MSRKCCGTCEFHVPMPMDEWTCDNEDSDNYGCETDYNDSCEDYSERE